MVRQAERSVKRRKLESSIDREDELAHDGNEVKVAASDQALTASRRLVPLIDEDDQENATPTQLLTPRTGTPRPKAKSRSSRSRSAASRSGSVGTTSDDAYRQDFAEVDHLEAHYVPTRASRTCSHVQAYGPALPGLCFERESSPRAYHNEAEAIATLSTRIPQDTTDEYRYVELNDFTVFRPPDARRAYDMCTLDRIQNAQGADVLQFNGLLSIGDCAILVRDVSFSVVAVDGYGDEDSLDMDGKVCIQTDLARQHDVWYRLGKPSMEYRRFHEPYLWLAMFTKYFIDFLIVQDRVSLGDFRSKFVEWLSAQYGDRHAFRDWHKQCGKRQNFCTSVAAYVSYLKKECYSIDDSEICFFEHPVWMEVDPYNLTAITRVETGSVERESKGNTVVTPFIHGIFKQMYFGSHLHMQTPTSSTLDMIVARKHDMCLTPWNRSPTERPPEARLPKSVKVVVPGDVVRISPDTDGDWRGSTTENWFAYVLDVHQTDGIELDLLWLYEPSDTTLGDASYPFGNELFLSDICDCRQDAYPIERVLGVVDVTWFASDPHAVSGYFVRQQYRAKEEDIHDFATLSVDDFKCGCRPTSDFDHCKSTCEVGDDVLVLPALGPSSRLVPGRLVSFDRALKRVRVRFHSFARDFDPEARANELRPGDEGTSLTPQRVIRKFELGMFERRDLVTTRYLRDGAGDCFYMLAGPENPSEPAKAGSSKGKYSSETQPSALPGLGLFCGGGNFDRGLEDGGAVKFRYAVDWDSPALHSYRANVDNPDDAQYFLGSVNDYLSKTLRGSKDNRVAQVGTIDFVSAGSPCPGFSSLQPDKQSPRSLQFASMVASVVAFVDVYSPRYLVMENVVSMTHVLGSTKQNVFSQILAALVALGYQVQQFLGDPWSHGSSQHRARVFIVARAPGLLPLPQLPISHDHPPDRQFVSKRLGMTSGGVPFGRRRDEHTVFPHVSAEQSTADLPDIGDSVPQICPQFPDHRTPREEAFKSRERMSRIPIIPFGSGLDHAINKTDGITSGEAYDFFKAMKPIKGSTLNQAYTRVVPTGLFPAFVTGLHLSDQKNGRTLHWEQPRSLSIMEVKRGFGYDDDDVLVGLPSQQMKILGNSVDRHVAFVLGLAIKHSWTGNQDGRTDVNNDDNNDGMIDDPRRSSSVLNTAVSDSDENDVWKDVHRAGAVAVALGQRDASLSHDSSECEAIRGGGFSAIKKMLSSRAFAKRSDVRAVISP